MKRVAGTCFCLRDGIQYALEGSLTIEPLAVVREPLVGLDGPHGFRELPRMPMISISVRKTPDLSLTAFTGVTDSTITAECADGTTYVLSNAFQSGELSLNAGEGTVALTFHGPTMTELGA